MAKFFNKFSKDITGVFWLAAGVFFLLALYSYNPLDPSFNSSGTGLQVRNFCGYAGSFLSDIFFQLFGVGAWLLPLSLLRMGYLSFRNGLTHPTRNSLLLLLGVLLVTVSLVGIYFEKSKIYGGEILAAGLLGSVFSQAFVTMFNKIGAAVVLWTATAIFLIYYTQRSLKEVAGLLLSRPLDLAQSAAQSVKNKAVVYLQKLLAKKKSTEAQPTARFIPIQEEKNEGGHEAKFLLEGAPELPKEWKPKNIIVKTTIETSEKRKKIQRKVENWELPKLSMLEAGASGGFKVDKNLINRNTQLLEDKLSQFNVNGEVVAVKPGPAVTMFEFKPNADVKISRITELADDLSLAMSAESVRIIAPLPGRDVVGIETSNPKRETVYLRDILENDAFWDEKTKLPLSLGKQANGEPKVVDLRKIPHLMVAGTTGSGKSVFVVSILTSLLFKHSPKTLRLILIDPKQVDLAVFSEVPHLLMPPIREPKKAVVALKWAIREMEKRYRSMSKFGARGIEGFNDVVSAFSREDYEKYEEEARTIEESAPHDSFYYQPQPYIVVVVEEFGDLMAVDKNNVEHSVVRLAQMARACGIHLVLAMQSPRKDVVTGLIKTNIPGRISFKVASKMDSRIILDDSGAERLLANGDMLFLAPGISKPERHHGAWIPEKDIQSVARFWAGQAEPEFDKNAMKMLEGSGGGFDLQGEEDGFGGEEEHDEMYDEILAQIAGMKEISASMLQRRFRLGYPRAARLIEIFEKEGVVGPANGSKPRQVLVNKL